MPGHAALRLQEQPDGIGHCVTHPVSCGIGVVGKIGGAAATSVFDSVAKDFAQFAEHATTWVWTQLDSATAVSLTGSSWDAVTKVTVELGVIVCVTMLLLQIIASVLRQDMGGMGRGFRGVVVAALGTAASFIVVDSLLSAVDSLSMGAMQALSGQSTWTALGNQVVHAQTLTGGLLGSAAMLLCALIMLLSSLVVWLALMVRKMLLIIGAAFAPIAFGGSPFDVTSAWMRRWIEFTLALIFSKLILVIIFGIGLQIELGLGAASSGTTQQITQLMTGLLVISIAGFSPWLALQFVHWAGGSFQQIHQHAQAAQMGAQAAVGAPQRMFAGAQGGASGLANAGASMMGGFNGNGAGDGGGDGGGGGGGGGGAPGGGRDASGGGGGGAGASEGAGGAAAAGVGAAETAYDAGKSQTEAALATNGGGSPTGASDGDQQGGSQQGGGQNGQPRGSEGQSGNGQNGSGQNGAAPARSGATGGQAGGGQRGTGANGGGGGGGGDTVGSPPARPDGASGGGTGPTGPSRQSSSGQGTPGGGSRSSSPSPQTPTGPPPRNPPPSSPGGGGEPGGGAGGGLAGGAEIAAA